MLVPLRSEHVRSAEEQWSGMEKDVRGPMNDMVRLIVRSRKKKRVVNCSLRSDGAIHAVEISSKPYRGHSLTQVIKLNLASTTSHFPSYLLTRFPPPNRTRQHSPSTLQAPEGTSPWPSHNPALQSSSLSLASLVSSLSRPRMRKSWCSDWVGRTLAFDSPCLACRAHLPV